MILRRSYEIIITFLLCIYLYCSHSSCTKNNNNYRLKKNNPNSKPSKKLNKYPKSRGIRTNNSSIQGGGICEDLGTSITGHSVKLGSFCNVIHANSETAPISPEEQLISESTTPQPNRVAQSANMCKFGIEPNQSIADIVNILSKSHQDIFWSSINATLKYCTQHTTSLNIIDLVKAGLAPNLIDKNQLSILDSVIASNQFQIEEIKLLLDLGAKISIGRTKSIADIDEEGKGVLYRAHLLKNKELLELLILHSQNKQLHGADRFYIDTALLLGCSLEVLNTLIENSTVIKDDFHYTMPPLFLAVMLKNLEAVKLLLKKDKDLVKEQYHELNVLDFSKALGFSEIEKYFQSKGLDYNCYPNWDRDWESQKYALSTELSLVSVLKNSSKTLSEHLSTSINDQSDIKKIQEAYRKKLFEIYPYKKMACKKNWKKQFIDLTAAIILFEIRKYF